MVFPVLTGSLMRHRLTVPLSGAALVLVLTIAACSGGEGATPVTTAAPSATSTATPVARVWQPFTAWAELHCEGAWTNAAFGTSGRYAITSTYSPQGATVVTIEADGDMFGGESGSATVPVVVEDGAVHITGDAGFLGFADVWLNLAQELSGGFDQPPGLRPNSRIEVGDMSLSGAAIRFEASLFTDEIQIPGIAVVTADCYPREQS